MVPAGVTLRPRGGAPAPSAAALYAGRATGMAVAVAALAAVASTMGVKMVVMEIACDVGSYSAEGRTAGVPAAAA